MQQLAVANSIPYDLTLGKLRMAPVTKMKTQLEIAAARKNGYFGIVFPIIFYRSALNHLSRDLTRTIQITSLAFPRPRI